MARWTSLLQMFPEIADNMEVDNAFRDMAQSEGLRARWIRKWEEVIKIREARVQAQEQQQELEAAQAATKSLQQAGGVEGVKQLAQEAQREEQSSVF